MVKHSLPGEGDHTRWFARLNAFEQQETRRQVAFKRKRWPDLPDGAWSKNPQYTYPHILPAGEITKALYEPIAEAVLSYCETDRIAVHTEALNLRSSQLCCFNVMFPLRQRLELAAEVLAPCLPGVQEVTAIEFEYTGPDEATRWLGEPAGGQRGQNRTSIDAAVWWHDGKRRCLTLVEWKYTERSYGTCGGFTSRGNPDNTRCSTLDPTAPDAAEQCYLTSAPHTRRYWEHMREAGIDLRRLSGLKGCPFIGPFYQIMRQYLLAAYLRREESLDEVIVLSMGFRGNAALREMPVHQRMPVPTVVDAWNRCLTGVPLLRHVDVEDLFADVKKMAGQADPGWLAYLADRYALCGSTSDQ